MGVEPTQDGITAPQTVLKTAPVTGPEAAPRATSGDIVPGGGWRGYRGDDERSAMQWSALRERSELTVRPRGRR
jgi:hypothetical protein